MTGVYSVSGTLYIVPAMPTKRVGKAPKAVRKPAPRKGIPNRNGRGTDGASTDLSASA